MAFGSKPDTSEHLEVKGSKSLSIRDRIMAEYLAKLIGQQVLAALAEDRAARITS
jgi:hypothetical protein